MRATVYKAVLCIVDHVVGTFTKENLNVNLDIFGVTVD